MTTGTFLQRTTVFITVEEATVSPPCSIANSSPSTIWYASPDRT
jgi:hypothetical protein